MPKGLTVIPATAGAGKTHTLLLRVEYLLGQGVLPDDIMITSFTREAATKLQKSLAARGIQVPWVGTMHHLSGLLLARARISADSQDQAIERAERFAREEPSRKFHVIVDEAQDLTELQRNWVTAWSRGKSAYAVGDTRQGIYAWRGADPGWMQEPQAALFPLALPYNRRSRAAIVALGNRVAGNDLPAKPILPGGLARIREYRRREDELREIVAWAVMTSKVIASAAVLARTNDEVAEIGAALWEAGVNSIKALTIHAAKGLEWDRVLVSFGVRKLTEQSADAVNVAYVAVTRAKEVLVATSTGQLPSWI